MWPKKSHPLPCSENTIRSLGNSIFRIRAERLLKLPKLERGSNGTRFCQCNGLMSAKTGSNVPQPFSKQANRFRGPLIVRMTARSWVIWPLIFCRADSNGRFTSWGGSSISMILRRPVGRLSVGNTTPQGDAFFAVDDPDYEHTE
jgi:hypothetical protein